MSPQTNGALLRRCQKACQQCLARLHYLIREATEANGDIKGAYAALHRVQPSGLCYPSEPDVPKVAHFHGSRNNGSPTPQDHAIFNQINSVYDKVKLLGCSA
jgi:hypothetical protein